MTLTNRNLSRREALGALGLMALSCRTGFSAAADTCCAAKPAGGIALQMYTMRDPAKKDLVDTLKKCREMGWQYVQWSGMPKMSAEEIRKALDDAGLKAIAGHTSMEPFEKDFETEARFWKTVGVTDLGPGGMMKDCKATLADWLKGAQRLDAIGAKLKEVGIRLTYHNHTFEFEKFPEDPRTKFDILMDSTKPGNLYAELDVGWAFAAGADPAAFLRKHKGRCKCLHAKDILAAPAGSPAGTRGKLVPLGQGAVNWKEVLVAARESGVEWYIYEQDNGEGSPFDYARTSYEFLSKLVAQ